MHTPNASTWDGNLWRNNRLLQILAGLLVVQLILVGIMYFPKGKPAATGAPLLGGVTVDDITAITVTDAKGKTISLEKQGDSWVLPTADNYPADDARVGKILDKLTAIKTDRLITKTADSHKRLEVAADKFQRKVELTTTGGEARTVFIGSSAGVKATHVRLDGNPETYLTGELSNWDVPADASGWVKPDFYSVNKDNITAVTIKNATGTLEFSKDSNGNWTLMGLGTDEKLDTAKVNAMLNNASKINLNRPIGKTADPALGMDDPSAMVTVTLQGESGAAETVTLTFGSKNDSNQYPLQTSTSDYLAWVSGFVGDTFAAQTRTDFIAQPPTPTPEATGG